ncbi:heavy metal translocating P-type ATPase [Camelliibacillus cellulosilyticus]|uniref:Heavy metal translocating P-type ATPase n=1 Tax=Camelliibacillus cellulosilyticus TaxID=2174486 RepID=A0ABV9GQU4_9BACL
MSDIGLARQRHLGANKNMDFLKKHGEMGAALVAGVLILTGWLVSRAGHDLWEVYLAAYIIGGFAKAKEGYEETVKNRTLNVELLMVLAAIGAACIGHWLEGAVLIFIFAVSGALESYTTNRNSKALEKLMSLQPETARLVEEGHERSVSASALTIGDTIRVKPGERVPVDGTITQGETTIDESAITGESAPVFRNQGGAVLAGTVNMSGSIFVRVDKRNTETLFSKILTLVQNAQAEKVPSQLLIEKIESRYVKGVLAFVALMLVLPPFLFGWGWSETIYRAMVMLVVASPCALVASTMPAVLSAITRGAKLGILVKGGVHLDQVAGIKAIAFDKTGTLTNGRPEVTAFFVDDSDVNERDILSDIMAIENDSTHPLASAIVAYCRQCGLSELAATPEYVQTVPGFGVQGRVHGVDYRIGKAGWIEQAKIDQFLVKHNQTPEQDATTVLIEKSGRVIGYIDLKDRMRSQAPEAIRKIQSEGIQTVMLTGDHARVADAIAKEVGVADYISDCLPEHKVHHLKKLKEKYGDVAMIGDGINDTPALATATLGIAMGGGTDAALETADVVLMKNDLLKITDLVRLSKKMNRIIKQNIIFSIAMIVFLIINNLLGDLSMTLGVIGHEGSTILVILNGLRLLK